MRPSNERRRYSVTSSLIGWAHTQNDPCCNDMDTWQRQCLYIFFVAGKNYHDNTNNALSSQTKRILIHWGRNDVAASLETIFANALPWISFTACWFNSSPLDEMAAISQTLFSCAFSWTKSVVFFITISLKFVPNGPMTINQHWFR